MSAESTEDKTEAAAISDQVEQEVSGVDDGKLTPEQIQNWRQVLCGMLGPYALIAPKEEIQVLRDRFQAAANKAANMQ